MSDHTQQIMRRIVIILPRGRRVTDDEDDVFFFLHVDSFDRAMSSLILAGAYCTPHGDRAVIKQVESISPAAPRKNKER